MNAVITSSANHAAESGSVASCPETQRQGCRGDPTDLVKLGAGTVQHGRVDVGLALHDERQLAVLVCVDVHLGSLVVLPPLLSIMI